MSRDALVVGINTYQDDSLPNLQSPVANAEAIAQCLENDGDFQVRRLPEAIDQEQQHPYSEKGLEVNLQQLEEALVQLFKPEGKHLPDTALFYFSGHGLGKTRGISEGFLASSNVDLSFGFYGLSLSWLRRLLQESPVRQQIIWLDCCYSDKFLINEANPGDSGQGKDRCFIAASRKFEPAYQDLSDRDRIFTTILLEGLNPQRTRQRWVTNISLVDYLNQQWQDKTQRLIYSNFGEPINLTRSGEVTPEAITVTHEESVCPYKGLEYFDCNDEDPKYFYGRRELTDTLVNHVREKSFLAILGASGSGKSSVLRAGLLHRLKLGQQLAGSEQWEIRILCPGKQPMQNLALAFFDLESAEQFGIFEEFLKKGSEGLCRLLQASESPYTVLVIDQFEEVFSLCEKAEEREQFFECLIGALTQVPDRFRLILAIRADCFGKCLEQDYHGLANQIQANLVTVTPMSAEQLREAIINPAERVNLEVEPELVEAILREINHFPGNLPLLQYTLRELWKRRTNNCLDLSTYRNLGGIGNTLNQRATEIYETFDREEQSTVKHIFLSLTQLGEEMEDTRQRVFQQDLVTAQHSEPLITKVVQKLADEKLVVVNEQIFQENEGKPTAVLEIVHEALIRHWPKLRQWLNESRDALREQRKIETVATEWQKQQRKTAYLLQGRRLREVKTFHKQQGEQFPLSKEAEIFIRASVWQQWKNRAIAVGISLVMPMVGIYFGLRESQLYSYRQLITECQGQATCSGRIEALEALAQAGRSLKRAELGGVQLKSANLAGANLASANLAGAELETANLETTNLFSADLSRANLSGADLGSANLGNVNFSSANLGEANLSKANLGSADLSSANLSSANLDRTNLFSVDLGSANLESASLKSADLESANLGGANLVAANLSSADLESADLESANLESADLRRTNLSYADLGDADLSNANVSGATLFSANLFSADLESANLSDADLRHGNLDSANLFNADLRRADLRHTDFGDANLFDTDLRRADLRHADFGGANLFNADLRRADLRRADLASAYFSSSNFSGANLRHADFSASDLGGVNLGGANLDRAKLGSANLQDVDFTAHETYGKVKNLTPTQVKSACFWQEAQFDPDFQERLAQEPEQDVDCSRWKE